MSRIFYSLVATVILVASLQAQDFNYQFTHSNSSYIPLTGGIPIANGEVDWSGKRFRLPIGFTFNFAGGSFDSLAIESNGFIKFDDQRAVVIHQGAGCKKDSSGLLSVLSRSLSGEDGNKILKIQFSNCGYDRSSSLEFLNYQVWLFQTNGKIEIHTGTSSYPDLTDSTQSEITLLVGLINPLQNSTTTALLLSGSPSEPVSIPIGSGEALQYLQYVPLSGKNYIFTPVSN